MANRISVVGVLICAAVLALPPAALAQGGAPAPDFDEPCPALYPGDDAAKERLARWMARAAAERGLPHELPVMAAIAESGLRNLRGERATTASSACTNRSIPASTAASRATPSFR